MPLTVNDLRILTPSHIQNYNLLHPSIHILPPLNSKYSNLGFWGFGDVSLLSIYESALITLVRSFA